MAAKSAHTVAGLLKLYFRELKPEPLMTFNLYECLIAGNPRVRCVRLCVCGVTHSGEQLRRKTTRRRGVVYCSVC